MIFYPSVLSNNFTACVPLARNDRVADPTHIFVSKTKYPKSNRVVVTLPGVKQEVLEEDGDGDDEMGLDPLSNLIKNHLNISAASNKSSQEVASQQNQAWQNLVAKQEASSPPQSSVATAAVGSRSFNIKQEPTESVQVMNARSGFNCFLLFHFLSGKMNQKRFYPLRKIRIFLLKYE